MNVNNQLIFVFTQCILSEPWIDRDGWEALIRCIHENHLDTCLLQIVKGKTLIALPSTGYTEDYEENDMGNQCTS